IWPFREFFHSSGFTGGILPDKFQFDTRIFPEHIGTKEPKTTTSLCTHDKIHKEHQGQTD
ncbi:MAG TPA: hypothetical protein PLB32_20410, partial [Acidobacteriota bacterium]|nr:hypothetical protein [Acidobacteriota bacterium]